ncbi:MAG TPA: hypothetical protein VKR21_11920 [Solirubrobacteraceae bacterium]|nr:hypothetical protein [Solirubrobacteraceae bacterium]
MTTEHEASRTLVKSPPELWAECSEAGSLARHLGEFGEITITRLDPETTVAWEGEHVSGTVRIEPSGWGTRVTLTARPRPNETGSAGEDDGAVAETPIGEYPVADEPPTEMPAADATEEEESDATLEKAVEAPDLPLAPDTGPLRIRWRRVTSSMRSLFRPRQAATDQDDDGAPGEEPAGSIPPPAATLGSSEPLSPAAEPPATMAEPRERPRPAAEAGAASVDAEQVLTAALDSLGQAHHRPFSRA